MDSPDMPIQAPAPSITDAQIREVFLAAGFTIKPGETDLRPYVYKAARDLIALAFAQQASLTALQAGAK
jgi:hypothetical protein